MRSIRRGVFETNSSSVHSLSIMSEEEYDRWADENLLMRDDVLYTLEDAKAFIQADEWFMSDREDRTEPITDEEWPDLLHEYGFETKENYGDGYENYETPFTTPKGERMVAFGYYGYDG